MRTLKKIDSMEILWCTDTPRLIFQGIWGLKEISPTQIERRRGLGSVEIGYFEKRAGHEIAYLFPPDWRDLFDTQELSIVFGAEEIDRKDRKISFAQIINDEKSMQDVPDPKPLSYHM